MIKRYDWVCDSSELGEYEDGGYVKWEDHKKYASFRNTLYGDLESERDGWIELSKDLEEEIKELKEKLKNQTP